MSTLTGTELAGRDTLVVGGTGNVGFYLVDAFARAGARVLVASRSRAKVDHLKARLGEARAASVVEVLGDVGTPDGARALHAAVEGMADDLTAVAAAPASWHQTRSMYQAGFEDFKNVIETRLYPHYLAAEAFLPLLVPGGSYTTINGPAGFVDAPQPGVGSISVAAAAQSKLIRAFAGETGGRPRVNDVVMTAFMGPQGTRPGSPLAGEEVGDFVASLASAAGERVHNRTLVLRDPRQVEAALKGDFGDTD